MAQTIDRGGHKYAVISEELYKNMRRANQRSELTESPEFHKVRRLDEEIAGILENKYLPDSMKAQMYSEAVAAFGEFRQRAPEIGEKPTTTTPKLPQIPEEAERVVVKKTKVQEPERFEMAVAEEPKQEDSSEEQKEQLKQQPIEKEEEDEDEFQDAAAPTPSSSVVSAFIEDTVAKNQERQRKKNILAAMKGKEHIVTYNPKSKNLIVRGHENPAWNFENILDYVVKNRLPKNAPEGAAYFLEIMPHAGMSKALIRNKELQNIVERAESTMQGKGRIRKWIKLYQ